MKHALAELAEAYESNADIPALAKILHRRLRLDPRSVAPTARGAETMVRLLAAFAQIPQGLAELRNEGYGTGHGQVTRISGIKPRHADLAARSAIAYVAFVLDTLPRGALATALGHHAGAVKTAHSTRTWTTAGDAYAQPRRI
jgi:hypothetical protein